jgi:hypothetical protein
MATPIPQNCTWVDGVSPADVDDGAARPVTAALYRPRLDAPWQDVELVSRIGNTFMLREVGKLWPGIILAGLDQVGFPGPVLEFREPFGNDRRAG